MTEASIRWVWRLSALAVLLIGWLFILFHNNFHVTPSVVFIGLGYFAGVATIYTLFKTGAAVVASDDEESRSDAAWGGLSTSARDELEREKRALLKAIKEAEFDHQMGKLSKRDVDDMIRNYRLRAIEVIKLLEETKGATVRDQIQREVRARLEVESVRHKIERAHAEMVQKKPKVAAKREEAAQAAARAAAATGAPGPVVAKLAAEAADQAEAEAEAEEAAQAQAEPAAKASDGDAKASAPPDKPAAADTDDDPPDLAATANETDSNAKEATP